jgi:integrase
MSTRKVTTQQGTRYQEYAYIDGRNRYVGTFDTARQAKVAGADAVKANRLARRRGATLSTFRDTWLADIHREHSTLADYKLSILRAEDVLGDMPLTSITEHTMDTLVRELDNAYAARTVRKTVKDLRAMLTAAHRLGYCGEPPSPASLPKVRKKPVEPLTQEQVAKVIEKSPDYWRPLFVLAATSGMRRGELLGVRVKDIDLDGGTVQVRQQVTDRTVKSYGKTSAAYRTISLPESTVTALKAHQPKPNSFGLMFPSTRGNVMHEGNFSRRVVRTTFDSAGIGAGDGLHLLRHTYASVLIARGCSPKLVQTMLGHEDVSTTLNLYTHLFQEDGSKAAEVVGAWVGGKKST